MIEMILTALRYDHQSSPFIFSFLYSFIDHIVYFLMVILLVHYNYPTVLVTWINVNIFNISEKFSLLVVDKHC